MIDLDQLTYLELLELYKAVALKLYARAKVAWEERNHDRG